MALPKVIGIFAPAPLFSAGALALLLQGAPVQAQAASPSPDAGAPGGMVPGPSTTPSAPSPAATNAPTTVSPRVRLAKPGETYRVIGLVLSGLGRTDRGWLEHYIDYTYPATMTADDALRLERKLLTTAVFTSVTVDFDPAADEPGAYRLHVNVDEKWTTIPVFRGVYGGGTPLRVFGMYDIHSFGRLVTLGGESRKYGDAPPGYVLYFRDPRAASDRYYLGAELWREFRRRQLYDKNGDVLGAVSTNMTMSRIRLLTPLGGDDKSRVHHWKYGFDLEAMQEAPSVFDPEAGEPAAPPEDLAITDEHRRQLKILPTLLYDDVDVDNLEYDGLRTKLKAGPQVVEGKTQSVAELETYYYKMLPAHLNLGIRGVLGQSTFNSLQNEYFLGGLDTIRGLPDGAIYGTHAAYANVELRHLTFKTKYLWLQSAVFCDGGGAAPTWRDAFDDGRATAGVGIRLAVPQIYRMIFRIDYGWSIAGPKTQGITAGMNQFFDPYIPL